MVGWNLYLSCSVYQLDTSWNTIHVDQTWKSSQNKFVCSVKQSVTIKKEEPALTGENIESCLSVLAVVSIEDVADDHAGLPHGSITDQHAAHLLPQPVCFVMSLTGLCHLFFFFFSQIITPSLRQQLQSPCSSSRSSSSSITVKDVLSHREVSWGQ